MPLDKEIKEYYNYHCIFGNKFYLKTHNMNNYYSIILIF